MNNTQQNISLGLLFAFLGTFLFALKSIFIKLAYLEGLNSDVVLMLRMAIALPIYLGILTILIYETHKTAYFSTLLNRIDFFWRIPMSINQ
jgi:uncharacterized membrane protein